MKIPVAFPFALMLLLAGCVERQPAEFEAPAIGEVRVEAGFESVHFEVEVSGDFRDCGVRFGQDAGALDKLAGARTETGFTVTVEGLEDGEEYSWQAYVGNGREEIRSSLKTVSTQVSPYVKIPDPVFKAWVVANHDIDGDGRISQQEAHIVTSIDCQEGGGARSLKGIECFPNLKRLIWVEDMLMEADLSGNDRLEEIDLSRNQLFDLDLSGCPRLQYLQCYDNHLSGLDLSACPSLRLLYCWHNDFTSLDLACLPVLEDLRCAQNDFSSEGLDLSANPKLHFLYCNEDHLGGLDLSSNPLLEELGCYDNPLEDMLDLTANPRLDTLKITDCPNLDEVWLRTGQTVRRGIVKDAHTQICYTATTPLVRFRDPAFKAFLVPGFDQDGDGEISRKEAVGIREISLCTDEWNIQSLQGIEHMPKLEVLNCTGSWIDGPVPEQPHYYQGKYRWPDCFGPAGTLLEVDVTRNPALKVLNLSGNAGLGDRFETLDLRNNPELEILELAMTYLNYPDVSFLTELTELNLSHLRGTKPDISRLTKLRRFVLDFPQDNQGDYDVDVSHCPDLEELSVSTARSVSDLTRNPRLRVLRVGNMNLHALDVSFLSDLEVLDCPADGLTELDLSGNPKLRCLQCQENLLTVLDVSANPAVVELIAAPMQNVAGENVLETLYVATGQVIPNVTVDRSGEHIPAETKIVRK